MNRRRFLLSISLLTLWLLLATGCSSRSAPLCPPSAVTQPDATAERIFSMELFVKSQDGRYTYYEISDDNQLSYAGGRMATQRVARPIGPLPLDVRAKLLALIDRHRLMQAESEHLFMPDGQISYDLRLKLDGDRQHLLAADDQVTGLKEMSDLLFRTQFAKRYASPLPPP